MACGNSCEKSTTTSCCNTNRSGNGYVCIVMYIILGYILLAIIIGSFIAY